LENSHRLSGESGRSLPQFHGCSPKEVGGERLDVGRAIAQWRNLNREAVQSVVEVFPKAALGGDAPQVAIGGGNHPHIHADLAGSTDALEGFLRRQDSSVIGARR